MPNMQKLENQERGKDFFTPLSLVLGLASRTHKCSFYFSRLTFPESSHHQAAQSVLGIHINSWQCVEMAFLSFGDFTPAGHDSDSQFI